MAKFYGEIGYSTGTEEVPEGSGKWVEVIEEFPYFGDVIRNTKQNQNNPDKLNDEITTQSRISIVADPYAINNSHLIKYVRWNGVLWSVSEIDPSQRPRLILSMGKVYNGPKG